MLEMASLIVFVVCPKVEGAAFEDGRTASIFDTFKKVLAFEDGDAYFGMEGVQNQTSVLI